MNLSLSLGFSLAGHLVKLISLHWITGGQKIHLHTEGLSPPTANEPIPFQYAVSEIAELQMHVTIPIPVHYAINKEKNQLFQERLDKECSTKRNILKILNYSCFKLLETSVMKIFSCKVTGFHSGTLRNNVSIIDVFLGIIRLFERQLFLRAVVKM